MRVCISSRTFSDELSKCTEARIAKEKAKLKKRGFGGKTIQKKLTKAKLLTKKPLKLELCSGHGDWVVAQAKAESDSAHWAALELRHDRVHSIFSRAVFEGIENLCILSGNASKVLNQHFFRKSVAHIFVNFPEPPHFSGIIAAEDKNHLLQSSFFHEMHRVLENDGRLTIFSDNGPYCRTLCETLSQLTHEDNPRELLFHSIPVAKTSADDNGVAKFKRPIATNQGEIERFGEDLYEGGLGVIELNCGVPGSAKEHAIIATYGFHAFRKVCALKGMCK